jgi:two-component system chemotaxis response regulator CheB
LSDLVEVNSLGKQAPYNCPNCGGVLWEMDSPDVARYRCHTGHSFTLPALLESQSEKIEETLWLALSGQSYSTREPGNTHSRKEAGRRDLKG